MRDRLAQHLRRSGLLVDCRRVLVAVSGGLDSVVLLHLFRFGNFGFEVRAAHFDHRMRPDSGDDADWVRGLCQAWSVPLAAAAAEPAPRSEAGARALRYEFLMQAAHASDCDAVLTAHHADDQAETLLFRMARGTGLGGLQGIRARRGIIVRPLLPFTRGELEDWARRARLQWREDPTNFEQRYARNRIRHVVLPALEQVSPGAAGRIAALAGRAGEAESAWQDVVRDVIRDVAHTGADGTIELARDRLLGYHPHVCARVMRHLLGQLGMVPDRAGTRAVMEFIRAGSSGAAMTVGGGIRVEREFDRIRLRAGRAPVATGSAVVIDGFGPGQATLVLAGGERVVRWGPPLRAGDDAAATAEFDAAALRFPLSVRGWLPGDRIRLPYGSKKVKKLFQERRVGRASRARVPVLVDAAGSVLWVVGVARSELAPPPQEQRVFSITVMDGESF